MSENTSLKDKVLLEKQVEPLFKATLPGGMANIFAAGFIYFMLYQSSHAVDALWLSGAVILFSIARIFVSNDYLKVKTYSLYSYLYMHVSLTFIIGLTWALYIYVLRQPADEAIRNIVFLVIFGLLAGSITTLSTYKAAYLAFMLPQFVSIITVFILANTPTGLYMALAVFLAAIFMMATSFNINRSHKNEINLTINNKALINKLNVEVVHRRRAQEELEEHKRNLEMTVEERTRDLKNTNTSLEKVIEKKVIAEENLEYLAYHDELTGLPNRNLLVDRISQAIKTSSRDKQKMAILFIDLDRFKTINDSLGHDIGDTLLQEVSSRLYDSLRDRDTISRNRSDEFVVVLERLKDTNEAINVGQKLINCLTRTFEIESHKIHLGASIGISIYPHDGNVPLVLLRNADTAMYRAKQEGGNQLQFYDQSMSNQLRTRLEIESELHNALDNDEFYMVYQPQVSCLTGKITGFESLIRWHNKKHGEVSPDDFVPLLEETGLIYSVGEWIISQVVDFIREQHIHDVKFSINLSSLQCNSIGLVDYIREEMHRTNINPNLIEFEITESLLIKDFEKTKLFLDEIHSIGCTIALDDFGTGYTSMNYLARLPVDVIKIDRSLVRNIDVNNNLRSIVSAIVTMSNGLGVRNIFEGVEALSELDVIKEMRGDIIQGYLFSKPLNSDDTAYWLETGKSIKLA
jgi:diguanylate cyclase (GGDEF)-like protein